MTGTLHEDQNAVMTISRCIILRMKNVETQVVHKSKHTFYVQ